MQRFAMRGVGAKTVEIFTDPRARVLFALAVAAVAAITGGGEAMAGWRYP